ncbi:MAG: hypothetical protein AAF085_15465, partial [Planctomycetota bacterium]
MSSRDLMNRLGKDARIVRYGVILPTEGALMSDHHDAVRKNCHKFMYRFNITQKYLAKGIGYAAGTVNQWLNGTYTKGDNDTITRKVNRWMEMEARKRDIRLELPYMPTPRLFCDRPRRQHRHARVARHLRRRAPRLS